MKLLESYSRSCSVPITNKPEIYSKFFPLGIDKYITIQSKSGMPAKDYSYFQSVVDLLFPILEKQGIKILHIGQDSSPLNNTINLNNATSIGQCTHVLKKSLCHISVDSWSCHYAGAEDVPLVSLYGSTTVENHSPYHFNAEKTIFLESHRNGNRASFQREEGFKTIDLILPEDICAAACKLLKLDFNYPLKTLFIGKSFNNKVVETALDGVINVQSLGIPNIVARYDYNNNLGILIEQMKISKVSIVTDKPLPINVLQQFKPNIVEILYQITENHNPDFCRELQDNRFNYRLFTKLPDEKLNPIKLSYLDFPIIHKLNNQMPEVLKDKKIENLFIRGGKFIVSKKGLFNSYWSYKNGQPIPDFNASPQNLIDVNIDDLWNDIDYLFISEKI